MMAVLIFNGAPMREGAVDAPGGADIGTMPQQLGHNDVATTMI